jgi:hypothetical protein
VKQKEFGVKGPEVTIAGPSGQKQTSNTERARRR